MVNDKIATVEDALEKAHHILAGMPVKYDLEESEERDTKKRTRQAQWLFTQKDAINTDISIVMDYIEKGLGEITSCFK